jgi:hypothetical protein
MPKFMVYVEETYAGYMEVEADSPADAEAKATDEICLGNFNPVERFDGNTIVEAEEMQNA